jgi:hypothetical protein
MAGDGDGEGEGDGGATLWRCFSVGPFGHYLAHGPEPGCKFI